MMEAIDNGQCFNPTSPSRLFLLQSWSPSMREGWERERFLFFLSLIFFTLLLFQDCMCFLLPFSRCVCLFRCLCVARLAEEIERKRASHCALGNKLRTFTPLRWQYQSEGRGGGDVVPSLAPSLLDQ
jgi:hypothetical protein